MGRRWGWLGVWLGVGAAGSGLRELRRLWEEGAFALCARGGLFASKARSGRVPLAAWVGVNFGWFVGMGFWLGCLLESR